MKRAREQRGCSLEAVARPAKITSAYLHKLENGVVSTPSPRVLRRLAGALDVPYFRLMMLSGYLEQEEVEQAREREPQPHPLAGQQLSQEEWRAVAAFIKTLISQRPVPSDR